MARIVISHLAPAEDTEIRFLCDLARAFEGYGHEPILWSAIYDRRFAQWYMPHNWRLKRLPEFYAGIDKPVLDSDIDLEKWQCRIEVLAKQEWQDKDRSPLLSHLLSVSQRFIESVEPDLFLAWNTLCPHTGIAAELCQRRGIKTGLIERAVFPNTWFLEPGGLIGHSVLAGVQANDLIAEDKRAGYQNLGETYLKETSFGQYNRYAQAQESREMEKLLAPPYAAMRPRVVFFPPDDLSLGYLPKDGDDRKKSIPGYESSFAAAKALARSHEGITIFKPHPSFLEESFDTSDTPNLFVVEYDFRKLIDWADIVASTGSGLEFIALAQGKPVLLQANDLLLGKGITYEAPYADALPDAVQQAYQGGFTGEQRAAFHTFVGYLLCEQLVSSASANPAFLSPEQIAKRVSEEWLLEQPNEKSNTLQEVWQLLLTPKWQKKLALDASAPLVSQQSNAHVIADKNVLISNLQNTSGETLYLDFDNTLLLENSTELFLKTIPPQWLVFLLVTLSDAFVGFCAQRRWCKKDRWRDYCRVTAVVLGMPWSWFLWKHNAAKNVTRHANHELLEAVNKANPSRVVVVSFGMDILIKPLLDKLLPSAELVACSFGSLSGNLRKSGKLAAITPHLQPEDPESARFVTDSEEDRELLNTFKNSYLIQWAPYPEKALFNTYFPFRYAVQGKYTRRRYFWNQIIKEDVLLLLLAYPFTPLNALALAALFVSFYAVYEIGLWENDHKAAKSEESPTLSKEHQLFSAYPIHKFAPVWAFIFGCLGIALLNYEVPVLAKNGLVWFGILAAVYGVFRLFNALPPQKRLPVFPLLHLGKTFSFASVLAPTMIGIPLLAAQVCAQCTNYILYRRGHDTGKFNRQLARYVYFIAFCILAILLSPDMVYNAPPVHAAIIFGWCVMRILERKYNTGLFKLLKKAAGRLIK